MASTSTVSNQVLAEDDQMFVEPHDLVADEHTHGSAPIFTRALLQRILKQKQTLEQEFDLPEPERTIRALEHHASDGSITMVWQDDEGKETPDSLTLHLAPRIELNYTFQARFGQYSEHIQLLRDYNTANQTLHLRTPYSFESSSSEDDAPELFVHKHLHKNPSAVNAYRKSLSGLLSLWQGSEALKQLCKTITGFAALSAPIKRIVCFGLGQLSFDNAWFNSVMQHITVFTIIKIFESRYKARGLNHSPIEIFFQDPFYHTIDEMLLGEMNQHMNCRPRKAHFVGDPGGLLAVNSDTLVITAFLPFQVPLMQCIADLFADSMGPAAFICDKMTLDVTKRNYILHDRDSPAVARFFTDRYWRLEDGFPVDDIETTFMEQCEGSNRESKSWLAEMDLHVRKHT